MDQLRKFRATPEGSSAGRAWVEGGHDHSPEAPGEPDASASVDATLASTYPHGAGEESAETRDEVCLDRQGPLGPAAGGDAVVTSDATAQPGVMVLSSEDADSPGLEVYTRTAPDAGVQKLLAPVVAQRCENQIEALVRDRLDFQDAVAQMPVHDAAASAVLEEARLLADGVIPGLLEGLLNGLHRRELSTKAGAARFLLLIMKAHGAYVYEHCTRLVDLSMALAREMGAEGERLAPQLEEGVTYRDVGEVAWFLTRRSPRQRDALVAYLSGIDIAQESLLHDLGKIQVPADVLFKPAALTAEERKVMQRHPVWGVQILESLPALHHALPVVAHHHERWDGGGYPDGLAVDSIPLAARIVSVVDAFDAMVSDRPYREALPYRVACDAIRDGAGTQFDPSAAKAFLRIIDHVWSPERQY